MWDAISTNGRPRLLAAAACIVLAATLVHGSDALTQHYNNARTGSVLDEKTLNTTTVASGRFGKLWTIG